DAVGCRARGREGLRLRGGRRLGDRAVPPVAGRRFHGRPVGDTHLRVSELDGPNLDGTWEVRRLSGALPPLAGVRKRIAGTRGETVIAGGPRLPFDVVGWALRYRPPLGCLVDEIQPAGGGFHGRATVVGCTYGQFELRSIDM